MRFTCATIACLLAVLISVNGRLALSQTAAGEERALPGPEGSEKGREPTEAANHEAPLPDVSTLMREVEANQRKTELVEKTYFYHAVETMQDLGSKGEIKKTTVTESDHFWLNGVPVQKVTRRDGKDLTPAELAKEDDRLEKKTRKERDRRASHEAQGKETDAQGHDEISVSRMLELGSFTNERRIEQDGRSTIAVDYTGDPHAKTHSRAEEVMKDLAGTAWIDEAEEVIVRIEGRFERNFKIGAGLLADIRKDTHFTFYQAWVNQEVWLPARIDAQGSARAMLFFNFTGHIDVAYSDYRKFRATATVLPDVRPVDENSLPREAPPER